MTTLLSLIETGFELLKTFGAKKVADADHKLQAFSGKFTAGFFKFLKLLFNLGVVYFVLAEQLIQFKLLIFDFRF